MITPTMSPTFIPVFMRAKLAAVVTGKEIVVRTVAAGYGAFVADYGAVAVSYGAVAAGFGAVPISSGAG